MSAQKEDHAHTALPSASEVVWMDGEYMPLSRAVVPITAHSLHYGTAVFEGIRFYGTDNGPAVFRLHDHVLRLHSSALTMEMKVDRDIDELMRVVCELIRRNNLADGYVRIIAYYGEGISLTRPDLQVHCAVFLLPWPNKEKEPVRLQVSEIRKPDPRTIIHTAKVAGHYVNSYMAAMSFNKQSFGGALMLDCDGWVAETPVANIFGVSGDVVFTPKIGSILPGITRESILGLAYYMGIPTQMGDFSLQDMKKASEVFITGTAAEVTPVSGIDAEVIGDGTMGPLTRKLSNVFDECARGKNAELAHWLTYV